MAISSRTREIVELLLEGQEVVRIREIANRLGLSERTVYRELPAVTDLLAAYQIRLPASGRKGICVQGDAADIWRCRTEVCGKQKVQVVDRDKRFYSLLLYLLCQEDYIKTEAIAIDLAVSLSTIRSDLREIERKFASGTVRIVSRKGTGIRLEGSVFSRDYLFIYCLLQSVEVHAILRWMAQEPDSVNPFLKRYEEQHDMETLRICNQMLWDFIYVNNQRYDLEIDDYNFAELVMLLAVAAGRMQSGGQTYFPDVTCRTNAVLTDFVAQWNVLFERQFHIRLSEQSIRFLEYLFMRRVNNLSLHQLNLVQSADVRQEIARFVDRIEAMMGINLRQDTRLMDGLCVHLDKALERVRSGMSVSNPFTQETRTDYRQLFQTVQESLAETFPNDFFPDDEVAYIVLYFAAILDRITKKSFRVMVVCSGGMGSSRMLANRLEMELPEIHIKKVTSIVGMRQEDPSDYDLVLSTIPLTVSGIDFLKVSPLLPEEDLELVRAKIRRHRYSMLRKIEEREKHTGNDLAALLQLQDVVD